MEDSAPFLVLSKGAWTNIVFRADGNGYVAIREHEFDPEDKVYYPCSVIDEKFRHEADIAEIAQLEHEREQLFALSDYFDENINPKLKDKFVDDENSLEDCETKFTRGNEEEMRRLIKAIAQSDPEMCDDHYEIRILGTTPRMTKNEIDENYGGDFTPRALALLEEVLKRHRFAGYSYEYTDNPTNRMSGFAACSTAIEIEIEPCSSHERMAAIVEIRKFIARYRLHKKPAIRNLLNAHEMPGIKGKTAP